MIRVAVVVENGVCHTVYANIPDIEVRVFDIDSEDVDPEVLEWPDRFDYPHEIL